MRPWALSCAWLSLFCAIALPPLVPVAQAEDNTAAVAKVTVKEVAFTGNTVFSAAELTRVVASALGTEVAGLDALKALATKVEAYYHQHGYLNARVVLPEQETDL
jgi:hemolysin activation/secretion protein